MIDFRENNCWTVYIHIVPKELSGYEWDKYYVGITSRETKIRWGNNGCGYKGQLFYSAISKYGWDNIKHEIIASNLTGNEACDFEQKLIELLSSNDSIHGYNIASGGEYNGGWHHTKENREKFHFRSAEGNNPNAKTLYQFTIDGSFINKYSCATEAARIIGRKISSKDNLTDAARNSKMCHGFLWAYEDNIIKDYMENIHLKEYKYNPTKKSRSGTAVYQFNKDKNFITRYEKISEASKKTNIPECNISAALSNRNAYAGEYIWRYEKDIEVINGTIYIKNMNKQIDLSKGNTVYLFDKDGKYINTFKSQKLAAKFLNGDERYVSKAIKNGKLYKGYYCKNINHITELNGSFLL